MSVPTALRRWAADGRRWYATGVVKFFKVKLRYGFLVEDGTQREVFVHRKAVDTLGGFQSLFKGERVSFDVETGANGPVAVRVRDLNGESLQPHKTRYEALQAAKRRA